MTQADNPNRNETMNLFSKEYYEALDAFESAIGFKPDREEKDQWKSGNVYCNGDTNRDWKMFEKGYALARCVCINS